MTIDQVTRMRSATEGYDAMADSDQRMRRPPVDERDRMAAVASACPVGSVCYEDELVGYGFKCASNGLTLSALRRTNKEHESSPCL